MKLLYFTDTHLRGTAPQNRTDDFVQTLLDKLDEIIGIAHDQQIDYIIHGGDLFDRPDVALSVVKQFLSVLLKWEKPYYFVIGNHDIYGHNLETINRTALGILMEVGMFIPLTKQPIFWEKDGIVVQVTGAPYSYDIDKDPERKSYVIDTKDLRADYAIHVTHGFLTDLSLSELIPHTKISQIAHTKADLTLVGHYHQGFGLVEDQGKLFLNPGAMVRISNHLTEMKRRPHVAVISLDDHINVNLIPLKTAKASEEVLTREALEGKAIRMQNYTDFQSAIAHAVNFQRMDILNIINEVASQATIDQAVREEAIRRIVNVQMESDRDEHEH